MAIWLLTLAASVVLAADSPSPIILNPGVTQMRTFVHDNIEMGNALVSLYASTLARANFLVQMEKQKTSLPSHATVFKRKETNIQAKLLEIKEAVKCAAADVFLLPITRANTENHVTETTHHGSKHTDVKAHKHEMLKKKIEEDQTHIEKFDSGRQDYKANICIELQTIAVHAGEVPNVVIDKFIELLKLQYNAEQLIVSDTDVDKSEPIKMQYQHDLNALNSMVKLIKNNHPIDWDDLKISLKKASAAVIAAKAFSGTDLCEIAWKRMKIVEDLITNVQMKLMIYQPYQMPHTKSDDITLLLQFQRGYEKAFRTQMKLILGELNASSDIYNMKMREMLDKFNENVAEKKWLALQVYLTSLNALGVVNQMSPRFSPSNNQPFFNQKRHNNESMKAYLKRLIRPDVSFLPKLPWCFERTLILKGKSPFSCNKAMEEFISAESIDFIKKNGYAIPEDPSKVNDFVSETKLEIKKFGKHKVYYNSENNQNDGHDFYKQEYEAAFAELKANDPTTRLTIHLDSFYCEISSDAWGYIDAYFVLVCKKSIMNIGMFRKLLTMIQYVDAHTTPLSAGLEDDMPIDYLNVRIFDHVQHATTKYETVLLEQLDAATYLDKYEVAHLKEQLEKASEILKRPAVQNAITKKLIEATNPRIKITENMCRIIYAEVVKEHQTKLAAIVSSMVYAPIVLEGHFYLSDIITIFYGVEKVDVDGPNLVWNYLHNVVDETVNKLDERKLFLNLEKPVIAKRAATIIEKLQTAYDALHRNSGFECQLQLEAQIRKFYVQFANIVRSMETQNEFKNRVDANLESMSPWLDNLKKTEHTPFIKQIKQYAKPFHDRMSYLSSQTYTLSRPDAIRYGQSMFKSEAESVQFAYIEGGFRKSLELYINNLTNSIFEKQNNQPQPQPMQKSEEVPKPNPGSTSILGRFKKNRG